MTAELAGRFRTGLAIMTTCALLIGSLGAAETWRVAFRTARQPSPPWVSALRRLPEDAVVLTVDVPSVAWWADRRAAVCPVGPREDLATVVRFYKAGYYLALAEVDQPGRQATFTEADLARLDRGDGWTLYRIVGRF